MLAGMAAAAALVALGVAVFSHRRALAPIAITLASAVSLVASLLIGLGRWRTRRWAGGSLREAADAFAFWSLGAAGAAGAALHLNALDADRARSVADARRSQRLELARDLHDFVAHDVSAIVVDAQAGRVVGASAPENALAALERIEEDALRALAAMDRTVQALREADDDVVSRSRRGRTRSRICPSWPVASRRARRHRYASTSSPKRSHRHHGDQ